MAVIRIVSFILVVIAGAAFAVLNSSLVGFNYYFGMVELPLSLLLALALFAGVLLGVFVGTLMLLRLKRELLRVSEKARLA